MAKKYTYLFSEGDASMRELLGGKGANLAEMTKIGLPVPQGFTITTEALIEDDLIRVKIIDGADNTETTVDSVEQIKSIVRQSEALPKRDFKILQKVEATEVNVMSDSEATKLIEYKVVKRRKSKGKKGIVNIDVLSQRFQSGARVTIEALHEMRVIPNSVDSVKVLANGILDKPLIVEADDFSLQAVKMIALTGGRVIRTSDK